MTMDSQVQTLNNVFQLKTNQICVALSAYYNGNVRKRF